MPRSRRLARPLTVHIIRSCWTRRFRLILRLCGRRRVRLPAGRGQAAEGLALGGELGVEGGVGGVGVAVRGGMIEDLKEESAQA